jgi:hypothetical protein
VLAAIHEEELVSKLVSLADTAHVLLLVKESSVSSLSRHDLKIGIGGILELDFESPIIWLSVCFKILLKKLILDENS